MRFVVVVLDRYDDIGAIYGNFRSIGRAEAWAESGVDGYDLCHGEGRKWHVQAVLNPDVL